VHTHHSEVRSQQRSIPAEVIDTLLAYGEQRRRGGADIYFLDRQARSRAANALGPSRYRKLERALDSYLVMADDGQLINIAHRYRRLKF
jgi:hypothetical protein